MCRGVGVLPVFLREAIRDDIRAHPEFYQHLPVHQEEGLSYPPMDCKEYFAYWNGSLPEELQTSFSLESGAAGSASAAQSAADGKKPDPFEGEKGEVECSNQQVRSMGFSAGAAAAEADPSPRGISPTAASATDTRHQKSDSFLSELQRPSWHRDTDSLAQFGKGAKNFSGAAASVPGMWGAGALGLVGGAVGGTLAGLGAGMAFPVVKACELAERTDNRAGQAAIVTASLPVAAVGGAVGAVGGFFAGGLVGCGEAARITQDAGSRAAKKVNHLARFYYSEEDLKVFFTDPLARNILVSDASKRTDRTSDIRSEEHFPRTLSGIQARCQDNAAIRVYLAAARTLSFLSKKFERNSIDDKGQLVITSLHYPGARGERNWNDAFWDPVREQLCVGDGDGRITGPFGNDLSTIAHEIIHGMTQKCIGLNYRNQSGALDEHISDVFAMLVNNESEWESPSTALTNDCTWYIGEDLFLPSYKEALASRQGGSYVHALRSMKDPGSSHKLPDKEDKQVSHMSKYEHTTDDHGGVHINSGIPNKAFYLFVMSLKKASLKKAATVWYRAVTSGNLTPDATFKDFAKETLRCANPKHTERLKSAWKQVGVLPSSS